MVRCWYCFVSAVELGLCSGGRSAILPGVDHVYRLKGCGNFVDQDGFRYEFPGFPVQAIEVCVCIGFT